MYRKSFSKILYLPGKEQWRLFLKIFYVSYKKAAIIFMTHSNLIKLNPN